MFCEFDVGYNTDSWGVEFETFVFCSCEIWEVFCRYQNNGSPNENMKYLLCCKYSESRALQNFNTFS